MYIVVVGGGRVGYYLSKALLDQGHEVAVVERDGLICDTINDELGSVCVRGDGSEVAVLSDIGAERADMLIAVTGDDEDNLVACQLAKHRFEVPRTISRVVNPRNEVLFRKLGVDVTVSSTDVILENIEVELPTHLLTHLLMIRDRGLEVIETKIPPDSPTVGKPVKDLALPVGTVLMLLIRKGARPFIPSADAVLQADDQVIAATPSEAERALRNSLGVRES